MSWMRKKKLSNCCFFLLRISEFDRVPRLARFHNESFHDATEGKKAIFIEISAARMLKQKKRRWHGKKAEKKTKFSSRWKMTLRQLLFYYSPEREIANEKSCHERIYWGFMIEWISQQIALRRLTRCFRWLAFFSYYPKSWQKFIMERFSFFTPLSLLSNVLSFKVKRKFHFLFKNNTNERGSIINHVMGGWNTLIPFLTLNI